VGGIALSLLGGAILLYGLWYAAFSLAWTNYSLLDLTVIAAILLYAVPAGASLLYGGIWAMQSATAGTPRATTARSRRTVGAMLLLPCLAIVVTLGLAYPDFRFWLGARIDGKLMVLLALLLAGVGVWLMRRAKVQNVT